MSWETSGSAGGLAKHDNFWKGPRRCVERPADSPHPDPLPQGEGTAGGRFRLFVKFVGQTPRSVVLRGSGGFSLSPRERAGVRGKVTFAMRTAFALQKSADRPKGRMALSHLFFHASGFAGFSKITSGSRSKTGAT